MSLVSATFRTGAQPPLSKLPGNLVPHQTLVNSNCLGFLTAGRFVGVHVLLSHTELIEACLAL